MLVKIEVDVSLEDKLTWGGSPDGDDENGQVNELIPKVDIVALGELVTIVDCPGKLGTVIVEGKELVRTDDVEFTELAAGTVGGIGGGIVMGKVEEINEVTRLGGAILFSHCVVPLTTE